MVRLDVLTTEIPYSASIDALKQYASVSDEGQVCMLVSLLKSAFDKVQRYADVALIDSTYRLSVDEHGGEFRVYMGGQVNSVVDASGNPVHYVQKGSRVIVDTADYVEAEFTTAWNKADYDRLLPVVLRYATALYDGKDTIELNRILREC